MRYAGAFGGEKAVENKNLFSTKEVLCLIFRALEFELVAILQNKVKVLRKKSFDLLTFLIYSGMLIVGFINPI